MEPYVFFMVLSYSVCSIPVEQLQQDKICLQQLNQSIDYCLLASKSEATSIKLSILSQSNMLTLYSTTMETITGIVWCLLTGAICDKHRSLRKIFMVLAPFSLLVGNMLKFINVIFYNQLGVHTLMASYALPHLIGSLYAGLTISFSYIATNSTESNRSLKFFAFEASYVAALAIGSLLSGQILGRSSWINGSEIRNYSGTFLIGSISAMCSMSWISFGVHGIEESKNIDIKLDDNENNNETEEKSKLKYFDILKEMFNVKEIYHSFKYALSKHSKARRNQILVLMVVIILIQLEQIGMYRVMISYTQRMYRWNYEMYSFVSTVASLTGPLISVIALTIFTKVFKLIDIETAMIGMVSLLVATTSIGSILSPFGFYFKIIFGSLSNMLNSSIRSKMSKVIDQNESTKIFAALTVMEVICPFIAAVIYTNTFNATILTYPSLIFQISAMTLFIPFILLIYIEFKYERKEPGEIP